MLSPVALNFILVIYSNATQLTYSLIGLLAMARRVIWIRSVCPSVQKFSWNWLFSFFQELKITSLQCLYNISKKKLSMEFLIFDVSYRFLMKVTRHVRSNEKRSLLNVSNILRKSIATAFMFYCDAKHLDTLLGSTHVCYLFLGGCGQKWVWSFRSWNSEICCISREWIDKMNLFFLLFDTNLGKLMLIW